MSDHEEYDQHTGEAPADDTPDFNPGPKRQFLRVKAGRFLLGMGRGQAPVPVEKVFGKLLGVTTFYKPAVPEHRVKASHTCVAKLRMPALGEVFVETTTGGGTAFVGMVGGLLGAKPGQFVAFSAVLAPTDKKDDDERDAIPPTFLNVFIHDGTGYQIVRRDTFPDSIKTGDAEEKSAAAAGLIPTMPAYVDPVELGAIRPEDHRPDKSVRPPAARSGEDAPKRSGRRSEAPVVAEQAAQRREAATRKFPDGAGASAFGYVPARWATAEMFAKPATESQKKMAVDKAVLQRFEEDVLDELRATVLKAYGIEADESMASYSLFIDWLMNADDAAMDAANDAMNVETGDPGPEPEPQRIQAAIADDYDPFADE